MAETVTMPKLGFDMAEGTLVRWVKNEGEPVAKGEVLAEIETDKATVEVESTFSGVVGRHLVEQGKVVPVGTPIATITAPGESADTSKAGDMEAPPEHAPEEEAAPQAVPVEAAPEANAPAPKQAAEDTSGDDHLPGGVHASPLARRIAREQGLDLTQVHGSGPGGRVVRKDLEAVAQPAAIAPEAAAAPAKPAPAAKQPAPIPVPAAWAPGEQQLKDELIPLEKLRSAIGRRMVDAKQQVPHFYVTHDYDMAALMDLRKQVNNSLPEDQKLSVNDFIVKAAALALVQFPALNASLEGSQIHRHGHINIGSAVSVPGGLLTVVNQDADQKPIRVISRELREMAARARAGKVRPGDIEGSTFSVSNLGMFDVEEFIAIINPPEAAILAVGSVRQVPVVVDGELRVGMRMKATISADHRLTDGAEAARFMQALAQNLEEPLRLLL